VCGAHKTKSVQAPQPGPVAAKSRIQAHEPAQSSMVSFHDKVPRYPTLQTQLGAPPALAGQLSTAASGNTIPCNERTLIVRCAALRRTCDIRVQLPSQRELLHVRLPTNPRLHAQLGAPAAFAGHAATAPQAMQSTPHRNWCSRRVTPSQCHTCARARPRSIGKRQRPSRTPLASTFGRARRVRGACHHCRRGTAPRLSSKIVFTMLCYVANIDVHVHEFSHEVPDHVGVPA
jgi:hypothetical protein